MLYSYTIKLVRFYDGADGLKTGNDDNAGRCIAVTAKKGDLRLILVSLGYDESVKRNSEAMNLLDYGFNQFEAVSLFKKGDVIGKTKLDKASSNEVDLVINEDILIIKKKSEKDKKYDYEIKLNDISYPIKKGEKLGNLIIKSGNEEVRTSNLYSSLDIKKINIIKLYFNLLGDTLVGS